MLEGGLKPQDWPAIAQELLAGKATDQKRAASLVAAAEARDVADKLENYLSVFLTRWRYAAQGLGLPHQGCRARA